MHRPSMNPAGAKRIIAGARERRRKAIVFVTGVPGAGKTLVGLNVATRHGSRDDASRQHAIPVVTTPSNGRENRAGLARP